MAANILICGLFFTGCSIGANSPSSIVKKVLNAVIEKDASAWKYFYNTSDSQKNELRELFREIEEGTALNTLVKFKIQDERIFDNGKKAEVIVETIHKHPSEQGEEFSRTEKFSLVKTKNGWKILWD